MGVSSPKGGVENLSLKEKSEIVRQSTQMCPLAKGLYNPREESGKLIHLRG